MLTGRYSIGALFVTDFWIDLKVGNLCKSVFKKPLKILSESLHSWYGSAVLVVVVVGLGQ